MEIIVEMTVFFLGLFFIVFWFARRLRRNGKFFLKPKRMEVDETVLDEEQRNYFHSLDEKLEALGFSFYKLLYNENWNAKSLLRLYVSSSSPDIFSLIETSAPHTPKNRVFSWKTRFTDGTYLITGAPRLTKGLFSPLPHHTTQSFWEYKEPKELLEAHREGLKTQSKIAERIFPERFPQELEDDRVAFYKERLRKGDFAVVPGQDYLSYSWKFAFRNVLTLTNPFVPSGRIKNQWSSLILAVGIFFSVFLFTEDRFSPWLHFSDIRQLKTLILIFHILAFYGGAHVLSNLVAKRFMAIYILGFVPWYWIFQQEFGIGVLCIFAAAFGMLTKKEKDDAEAEEKSRSFYTKNS